MYNVKAALDCLTLPYNERVKFPPDSCAVPIRYTFNYNLKSGILTFNILVEG